MAYSAEQIAAGAAVATVIITAITAILALVAILTETRRGNLGRDVQLTLELDDRFNRPEMRRVRALAASAYLAGSPGREFDDILNFFELAGVLAKRKAIGANGLRIILGDFVFAYWYGARPYIEASQKESPALWSHVAYLHDRFMAMDGIPRDKPPLTPAQLRAFMQAEASLPG